MTIEEAAALQEAIDRGRRATQEAAAGLSAAFESSRGDDLDSLLLYEAERDLTGVAGAFEGASQKLAAYLGMETLRAHAGQARQ